MIDSLANAIALKIKSRAPDHPASERVLTYSLSLMINAFLIISLSLLISVFTDKTKEVVLILTSFAVLRQVSGGLHLKSGLWCVIATTAGATTLSLITMTNTWTISITVVSLLGMILWAPTNIEKQSRIPKKYYPLLKMLSCMVVGVNLIFISDVIALTFLVQALTLYLERR